MRVFIAVVVLIFNFQSLTKADDIRDFEIAGISLKDDIENFLNNSEIKKYKVKSFKTEEYITLQFDASKLNSKDYEIIEINYKKHNSVHFSEFPYDSLFWWSFDFNRSGLSASISLEI